MLSLIAWIPGLITAYVAFFRSPAKAFMMVYLPVLILLPQTFSAQTSGFPHLNFSQAAVIPIFLAFLCYRKGTWVFSFTDFLVLLFIAEGYYSIYLSDGFHFANNKLATTLCNVLASYVLAKNIIHHNHLDIPFARRLVFLMFINVLLCIYEEKMTQIPMYSLFAPFFGGSGADVVPLFRYGLVRVQGPFDHTILFGIGLAMVLLINTWLNHHHLWSKNFRRIPSLFFKKGTIISIAFFIALLLTASRGPLVSYMLGFFMLGAGFTKRPLRSILWRISLSAIVLFFLIQSFLSSTNISSQFFSSDMETNIAYRRQIFDLYMPYVWDNPYWGWGSLDELVISGFRSIDNEYLYILLQRGFVGFGIFVAIIIWMMIRLLRRTIRGVRIAPLDSSLSFTLMTLFLVMAFSFLTVFMGLPINILFFLITGWAEGLLVSRIDDGAIALLPEKKAPLTRLYAQPA